MIDRTIAHYEILGELGAGGMGRVYRARDSRLGREVAIKALSDDATEDSGRLARFEREARVLASLNHPHIGAIHGLEEVEGRRFLILELVEGETLAALIARGPLPALEALRIGGQIAEALAAAHTHGIVHRDLKPSNIMLTPDAEVKVLDFGLAKRQARITTEEDRSEAGTWTALTGIGAVLGTAPYMSPEQLRGGPVDERTDIWSFGCVLYEMLTGRSAFGRQTWVDTTSAILEHDPDWEALPSNLKPGLERLLIRCLQKERSLRFLNITDVRSALDELRPDQRHSKTGVRERTSSRLVALGALVLAITAVGVSALVFFGPQGPRDRVADLWSPTVRRAVVSSIAVLPLANLSGDPEREYLADGMTEALISRLSTVPSLRVISRTSVVRYKGTERAVAEIAKELGVDAIVEGAVRESEGRLGISARLIHAADDAPLWAGSYERDLGDLLALQLDVARSIASGIERQLGAEQERLSAARPVDAEAHDAYLLGSYFLNLRTPDGFQKAPEYFNRAITLDPTFAPPYAGLAALYNALGSSFAVPPQEAATLAIEYATKALALDDTLAEAHAVMALAKIGDQWNWAAAESGLERALELNESYSQARQWYGQVLVYTGRTARGLAELETAIALDPFSLRADTSYGLGLYFARDYDRAVAQFDKALELHPNYPLAHLFRALCLLEQGERDAAIDGVERAIALAGRQSPMLSVLGYVYGSAGRLDDARDILEELVELSRHSYVPGDFVAAIYIATGETDRAFEWLEKAYEGASSGLVYLGVSPVYDRMRADPRYQDLMRRVGLRG